MVLCANGANKKLEFNLARLIRILKWYERPIPRVRMVAGRGGGGKGKAPGAATRPCRRRLAPGLLKLRATDEDAYGVGSEQRLQG